MTLIEMVAALAIASVVAAASLHVLSRLPRAQHQGQKEYALASADAKLGELFRADLSHAVRLRQHDAELQLQVRLSLDAETMRFRHVPSEVTYILRDIGGEHWLLRRQLDDRQESVEAVCDGVHGLTVTNNVPDPTSQPADPAGWQDVGSSLAVQVELDDTTEPLVMTVPVK